MLGCKIAYTPMNVNKKLISDDSMGLTDDRFFRSIVVCLNYLSHTRSNIAFPISVVSSFMHNPTKHHFGELKQILRYVAGTTDFGIWYSRKSDFRLFGSLIVIGQVIWMIEKVLLGMHSLLVQVLYWRINKYPLDYDQNFRDTP